MIRRPRLVLASQQLFYNKDLKSYRRFFRVCTEAFCQHCALTRILDNNNILSLSHTCILHRMHIMKQHICQSIPAYCWDAWLVSESENICAHSFQVALSTLVHTTMHTLTHSAQKSTRRNLKLCNLQFDVISKLHSQLLCTHYVYFTLFSLVPYTNIMALGSKGKMCTQITSFYSGVPELNARWKLSNTETFNRKIVEKTMPNWSGTICPTAIKHYKTYTNWARCV